MLGLLIPIYNRPEYLKRCLDSLRNVDFPKDTLVVFIDDHSEENPLHLIQSFDLPIKWAFYRLSQNVGIRGVLSEGYKILFRDCQYVINLDSDAIVKPNFIIRLLELKAQFPDNIISGFNSRNEDKGKLRNPIISEHDGYALKQYANGINMLIDRKQYEVLKPVLEKDGNWDFAISNVINTPKVIAVPSLVQHIGVNSTMGHSNPDVACDFKLLSLPNVTLFGIDAHDPKGILRAAEICTNDVEFGEVKIITERLFQGREGYSRFCIESMAEYVTTSHVLIIHSDGYIQDATKWDDKWLEFDYVGASWWFKDGMNCGNGGFSLRSKKLLDILATLDIDTFHPEDEVICRKLRPWLESEYGIKFAPTDVCDRFSIEAYNVPPPDNVYSGQFGFHGYHVTGLPKPMPPKANTNQRPQSKYARQR